MRVSVSSGWLDLMSPAHDRLSEAGAEAVRPAPAETTSRPVSTSASNVPSSSTSDAADDFLARAQALGLKLSRTDYERTRAGVAAFLKAERLPSGSPCPDSSEENVRRPERAPSPSPGDAEPAPQLSRWLRTTSGQISFFTAVVHPMSGASDEPRTRLSLDEVGSAEEKRRRRQRRRRLLEKQMMLECGGVAPLEAASPALTEPSSPARTIRAASIASDYGEPESPKSGVARSSTPPRWRLATPSMSEDPATSRTSPPGTPDAHVLNRMARVDADGKLWLAPRPTTHSDEWTEPRSEDSWAATADDSQPSIDEAGDVSDSTSLGWGPRPGARPALTDNLNACMKSMSLLDRIMLSKTSPRRARREAKARARRASGDEAYTTDLDLYAYDQFDGAETSRDASMMSWADVSTDSLDAPESSRDAMRPSHSRQPSASMRWSANTLTPRRPPSREEAAVSPLTAITPLSRYDPGTQITPMRYSPSLGYDCAPSRTAPLAFSPNMLTPWTHQGRLMSNAGLSNLPSSPFITDGSGAHPLASSTATVRGSHFALSSTPLSHLPPPSADVSTSSPSRLQCIESFPGRSPLARPLESPTRRAHWPSPLTDKSSTRGQSLAQASPTKSAPAPTPLSSLWTSMPPVEARTPFRRTDTIRPADIFGTAPPASRASVAMLGPSPEVSTPTAAASTTASDSPPESEVDEMSTPTSPDRRTRHGLPRVRMPRRKSTMARSASAAVIMTPTHSNDVFTHTSETTPSFKDVFRDAVPPSDSKQTEWDQPDGSRIVKLVSEELQAALESGTLEQEPEPRYFRLPPGHGTCKTKPSSVSYAGLIGQAILSSSDGRLSLAEIYTWISSVYPFYERGDRGWQNSIRHNLSLNKSFVKLERESSIPGKGGWWAIEPGHEYRFQNGLYLPNGQRAEAPTATPLAPAPSKAPAPLPASATSHRPFRPTQSAPAQVLDERPRKKRIPLGPHDPNAIMDDGEISDASQSFKRPKTSKPMRFAPMRVTNELPTSPVSSSPLGASSQEKAESESFDTSASTSRSFLATPGSGAMHMPHPMHTISATRTSPSTAVRRASSSSMLEMPSLHPMYMRSSANGLPDYGMMYMGLHENAAVPTDYPMPMSSSPHKRGPAGAAPLTAMPGSGHGSGMPLAYTNLQAHVPMVPAAPFASYAPDQAMPTSWPDAVPLDMKRTDTSAW